MTRWFKFSVFTFTACMFAATHALAQQAPAPAAAPKPAQTPKLLPPAPVTPPRVAPAPAPLPVPELLAPKTQPVNIRVDLAITESGGSAPPVKKTVSTVAADGFNGSVRELAATGGIGPNNGPTALNFDAQPFIQAGDKIRVGFTVQYTAGQGTAATEQHPRTDIRLNLTLLLENGKALRVWEGADPVDKDRRVTVEITATTLR